MTDQTEELLRAGMERFAEGTSLPPGLAARAIRRRKSRRATTAAAMAGTVTAATAAAAVIAAVAVAGPAPVGHVQTAAYVVSRTESALADATGRNLVEYARVSGSLRLHFSIGSGWLAMGPGVNGEPVLAEWLYGGKWKLATYSASGQLTSVVGNVSTGRHVTITSVSYADKTWSRRTTGPGLTPTPDSGCAASAATESNFLGTAPDPAARLRTALNCGQFTLAGTEEVDGVRALKLQPVPGNGPGVRAITYWVDPSSYLPVRSETTFGTVGTLRVDYRWLRPSGPTLAELDVTIPAGFREVPAP